MCKNNILIVTHGDALGSFVALTSSGKKSIYKVNYCGLLIADYSKELGWTLNENAPGVGIMND
jgi:hypothetical protein